MKRRIPSILLLNACLALWWMLASGRAMATLVTFQVDLGQQPGISPDGVHVLGSFNGFDPGATVLGLVSPGRYAVTLNLATGDRPLYKFVNGNAWDGTEGVFGECAFNTYRILTVPANDTVLPWVCFGHCDSACTPVPGTRIACVGNSITFGLGLADPVTQAFPSRLQASLGQGYLVGNFGASGTAVIRIAGNPYVQSDPFRHLLQFAPREVLLLLGINDSKSAIWGPYDSRFAADYDSLWTSIDTLPSDPHVWIGLPTTAFSSLFGIDNGVLSDSIIPLIVAHARLHALDQIDLHGFSSGRSAGFPDGIHPDSATHQALADEILRIMQLPRPQIVQNGQVLSANGGFAWQWYHNGDTVATAAGGRADTILAGLPGIYKVAVQVDSLWRHILVSESVVILPIGTSPSADIGLTVYPNPNRGILAWNLSGLGDAEVDVRLMDAQGNRILQYNGMQTADHISVTGIASGHYHLELRVGEIRFSRMIVLE